LLRSDLELATEPGGACNDYRLRGGLATNRLPLAVGTSAETDHEKGPPNGRPFVLSATGNYSPQVQVLPA
jgi:hypothetical protein